MYLYQLWDKKDHLRQEYGKLVASQQVKKLVTPPYTKPNIYGGEMSLSDLGGGSIDIHKAIMKLPKPKKGWVPYGYKYLGPGNPLEKQADFNRETGKIREYYVEPTGKTDAVAAQHDVDYTVCENKPDPRRCKNEADRKMVASLDAVPYSDRQWGHALARNIINTKQKLGLGNGQSRRVKT